MQVFVPTGLGGNARGAAKDRHIEWRGLLSGAIGTRPYRLV